MGWFEILAAVVISLILLIVFWKLWLCLICISILAFLGYWLCIGLGVIFSILGLGWSIVLIFVIVIWLVCRCIF